MVCCGKKTEKAKNILRGYVSLAIKPLSELASKRLQICQECSMQTWMTLFEYAQWILKHGIRILKYLDQLDTLPYLPDQQQNQRDQRQFFCRICKCFIPAKVRIKDETCPLGKWEK